MLFRSGEGWSATTGIGRGIAAEAGKVEDDSVEPRLPRLDFVGEEREVDAANLAVVLDPCGEVLRRRSRARRPRQQCGHSGGRTRPRSGIHGGKRREEVRGAARDGGGGLLSSSATATWSSAVRRWRHGASAMAATVRERKKRNSRTPPNSISFNYKLVEQQF